MLATSLTFYLAQTRIQESEDGERVGEEWKPVIQRLRLLRMRGLFLLLALRYPGSSSKVLNFLKCSPVGHSKAQRSSIDKSSSRFKRVGAYRAVGLK